MNLDDAISKTSTSLLNGLHAADNSAAWRSFTDRYRPMLMAFIRRVGVRPSDADDVCQATLVTFLTAYRGGAYNRERGSLRVWLRGIAFNKVRECRRRIAKHAREVAGDAPDGLGLAEIAVDKTLTDIFDQEWERSVVAHCVELVEACFDSRTFEAFRRFALDQEPVDQVAQDLGISRNTVYVYKHRVLEKLASLQEKFRDEW